MISEWMVKVTPTADLDIIFNVPPLDIPINQVQTRSFNIMDEETVYISGYGRISKVCIIFFNIWMQY